MKTIQVSDATFKVLSKWASVGRTIDATIDLLGQCNGAGDEDIIIVMDELADLKQPLDDCNRACKEARAQEQAQAKNK